MNNLRTQVPKPAFAGLIVLLATGRAVLSADSPILINQARASQPFIRELATGYLLQYSFLSPRPYCWTNDNTVMLSGWEVDKSGGHYCHMPAMYGLTMCRSIHGAIIRPITFRNRSLLPPLTC